MFYVDAFVYQDIGRKVDVQCLFFEVILVLHDEVFLGLAEHFDSDKWLENLIVVLELCLGKDRNDGDTCDKRLIKYDGGLKFESEEG